MNAEIIAVGTELLLGQILNTNTKFLSQKLAAIGMNVYYQTVVGDNAQRLRSAIETAQQRADILIFTGGLGPTKDDLTKETIAAAVGSPLVYDETALRFIEEYFERTGRPFTENNKKQALVLEGAVVFPNDHGMAPGIGLKKNNKVYILLPGPPKEMQPMYNSYVESFLLPLTSQEVLHSRVLRFFGIGESLLEETLQDVIDTQTNPTIAPLAADGEVTLRLTAKHADREEANRLIDELENAILTRVGEFFYGYDADSLLGKMTAVFKEKKLTLACAESLTGGLFGEKVTELSGASSIFQGGVICYSNDVKQHVLGVPEQVLQEYGAVSEECAILLAEKVTVLLGADVGVSFTGVAGPGELEGKQPGTVYIGIAGKGMESLAIPLKLWGTRQQIRERAVNYGMYHLYKKLDS